MEGCPASVVIIEDDEGVGRLQEKRLQRAGYAVQRFTHPGDALGAIRGGADLIILDYRLADHRTGLEFYEELKGDGIDIPAILVTGFANESLIITALRAGMRDFVSKSAEYLDYLPEAVGRVLRQRQIERSLAETEARFETVFRASPIGIAISVLQDSRFVDANDTFLRILGCTRQELIGSTSMALGILPHDFDREEIIQRLREERSLRHLELPIRNRLGRELVLELSAELINLRGTECVLSLAEDITDRRETQELLRLQRRAMNATSEGIVIADAGQVDLPLVVVNEAFEQLTGYSRAEVIGKNCRFLQGVDTDRATIIELGTAIKAGRPVTVEILNYRKDGRAFWNQLSVTPVRDDQGTITHFVGIQRDITERRMVADQLRQSQKLEAIGRLAGGVAHDFNNILTIILGNAELAIEDLTEGRDCIELLNEVIQAGQRAAGLTRQLLAFSRRQILEPRVIDLNLVVKDAEKLLKRLIGEDVALKTSLQPRLRKIKADPVQLEQILLNLTVNSRDAMPQGGQLLIETCNIDLDPTHSLSEGEVRAGPYVMLAISDTGHGMDSQTRSRIFEPFFTTKERGRGTGLGLSTVYGIVQQSGGYIWVYSEPGHGTSFKIYLPECRHGDGVAPQSASRPSVARGIETLLLVEDEAAVRSIAKRMLEGQGYRVLDAGSGIEAVELSAKFDSDIHLLVTDVVMPGMSGRQLAEEIQLHRPRTRVLYISGYTDNTISYHGVLQEGVAFMQKPFSQESLASKVREVLDAAG